MRKLFRRAAVVATSLALLLAIGAPATANSIPRSGDQLSLFPAPSTMPADTAFWMGYGFTTVLPELPSVAVDGTAVFELWVDGSPVKLRRDVEFRGGATGGVRVDYYHNFLDGLPAGEHSFEARWAVNGSPILEKSVVVTFE